MMILRHQGLGLVAMNVLMTMLIWAGSGHGRATADEDADKQQPNVLVILTDDQGWGDLSLHGNRNLTTPHLDALAKSGARFSHFYVQPVCSPTRAEFLTGRWHPRGGVRNVTSGGERLDLDEMTIADVYQMNGYRTGLFGKWHNGTQGPYHPNRRGFDEFYGFTSGHWGHYFSPLLEKQDELTRGRGYLPDDLTGQAIEHMTRVDERPFFTVLTLNTPHSPMQVPDSWWQRVADRPIVDRGLNPDKEDVQFTRAAMAMVENIDWNVGRMMATLEQHKLRDNTIVVFFCDNGPNSNRWNGGMRGQKGSTDEGGTRSPLFISWPGHIDAGSEVSGIAGAVDLLPTLVELAGIPFVPSVPLDGVSHAAPLSSPTEPSEDRLLFAHWNGKISVRSQQFRLDDKGRLYDIAADPGQSNDVTGAHLDLHQRLTEAVEQFRTDVLGELGPDDRALAIDSTAGLATTLLPARDAEISDGLKRSSRHPNCSFITNWTKPEDRISWDVEVLEAGWFDVDLLHTCAANQVGAVVRLQSDHSEAGESGSCAFVIEHPVEAPERLTIGCRARNRTFATSPACQWASGASIFLRAGSD
jgi:arylsulfatase A-like enzyme